MNSSRLSGDLAPYRQFSKSEWAALRGGEKMTLSADDVVRLRALNDPISLEEVEQIYLPLARLLSLYVEATQGLHRASATFLQHTEERAPYIIGVAGSVAVGKSTTARLLKALLARWPSSPKVDLVTTDGFLLSNAELEARGLMERKGFPESYDRVKFLKFLSAIKAGEPQVEAPLYSHLVYDVLPGEAQIVDRPDILIVEGLNILQTGETPKSGRPLLFASDFLDFSIYVDAEEPFVRQWFVERFMTLRATAFQDPNSFFHRFTKMSDEEARDLGGRVWTSINLPNLTENILPTRGRADLILAKGADHGVVEIALRRL